MAKKWIQSAHLNKGASTKQAQAPTGKQMAMTFRSMAQKRMNK